jgi:hypothetical protein
LKEEKEKPIQLIKWDQSNLSVNPIAINRIKDLKQKISSISVLVLNFRLKRFKSELIKLF